MVIFKRIALEMRIIGICNKKLKSIIRGYINLKKPCRSSKENPTNIKGINTKSTIG